MKLVNILMLALAAVMLSTAIIMGIDLFASREILFLLPLAINLVGCISWAYMGITRGNTVPKDYLRRMKRNGIYVNGDVKNSAITQNVSDDRRTS